MTSLPMAMDRAKRESEAARMREAAYQATLAELNAGTVTLGRAVANLRHAYRRAARFALDAQPGATQ